MSVAEWRLIVDVAREGAWNMALDRAMLESYEAGESGPTLRLYQWLRPTVSLGRFQQLDDVSRVACEAHGVDVCRRPTGGRGVLHDDELTYSIVSGVRDGLPRGTAASYRLLCSALVEAYRALGIEAALTPRPRGPGGAGACYLHATAADLSLGAAKLSGSAQVWSRDACLQHGSFVVSRDVEREAHVFGLSDRDRDALASTTSTMVQALDRRPGQQELIDSVIRGVEAGLGVHLEKQTFTGSEFARAEALVPEFVIAW